MYPLFDFGTRRRLLPFPALDGIYLAVYHQDLFIMLQLMRVILEWLR